MLGPRTYRSVPTFAHKDRTVVAIRSSEQPADVIARYPDRVIYIGGGPPVWTAYAPFIRHWDVTRLPYDGAADWWFDPAAQADREKGKKTYQSKVASRPALPAQCMALIQ